MSELKEEKTRTVNRINTYDRQLLRLEAMKPIKDVLQREKEMVRKRTEEKGREALDAYKAEMAKTQKEQIVLNRQALEAQRIKAKARREEDRLLAQWTQAKKLHEARKDRDEKLKALRESYEKRIADIRKNRDEKLKALRESYEKRIADIRKNRDEQLKRLAEKERAKRIEAVEKNVKRTLLQSESVFVRSRNMRIESTDDPKKFTTSIGRPYPQEPLNIL